VRGRDDYTPHSGDAVALLDPTVDIGIGHMMHDPVDVRLVCTGKL
jgi:hypothetical protein